MKQQSLFGDEAGSPLFSVPAEPPPPAAWQTLRQWYTEYTALMVQRIGKTPAEAFGLEPEDVEDVFREGVTPAQAVNELLKMAYMV